MDEQDNDFIDIEEAAEFSGYSVHTLRKLCQRGEIPFHQRKKNADLRFRRSELSLWIEGKWSAPETPAA